MKTFAEQLKEFKGTKQCPWKFNLNVDTLKECLNTTYNSGCDRWLCEITNSIPVSYLTAFNKSKIKSFDKDILLDYLFYLGFKVATLYKDNKTFISVDFKNIY